MPYEVVAVSTITASSMLGISESLELLGFPGVKTRPVKGSTGRVSRGPPLRPIASIGGGGSNPALNRIRWTGSEGWAPTESQYLTIAKSNK